VALANIIVLAHAGGGSPYEAVVKEMVTALDALGDVLATITDEPSAKAARPAVRKAAGQLEEVRKKAEDLKQPDKAEKDRIAKAYKDKLDRSLKRLLAEEARVKAIPGGPEALKEIQRPEERKK
jgi:hypothetical protein